MGEISAIFGALETGGESSAELSEFFGSYQLLECIGTGGAARVFRARHVHPQYADQPFALKVLHDSLSETSAMRSLFKNEGYFLSLLNHPNIVHTHEAGIEAGHPFIAMEFVDGIDLGTIVDRMGPAWRLPTASPTRMASRLVSCIATSIQPTSFSPLTAK